MCSDRRTPAAAPRRRWPSSRTPCGWERNPSAGPNRAGVRAILGRMASRQSASDLGRPPQARRAHHRACPPSEGALHERRDHRRPEPKSPPRLLDRRDVRGRHRADRHGDQVAARRQSQSVGRLRPHRAGRAWLVGAHIAPFEQGNRYNREPKRTRKLLLHRSEIDELLGRTKAKGQTIVPLRLYISTRGRAKVELALARGKQHQDRRRGIAERDARRDVARELADAQRGRQG